MSANLNVADPNSPPPDPVAPDDAQGTQGEEVELEPPELPAEVQARLAKLEQYESELQLLRPLRDELNEVRKTAQYWYEQSRTPADNKKQEPPLVPPAPARQVDPDRFVNAITSGEMDGVVESFDGLGYVRSDHVQKLLDERDRQLDRRLAAMYTSYKLEQDYPELRKEDSDLHQETKKVIAELTASADWNNEGQMLVVATNIARARLAERQAQNQPSPPVQPAQPAQNQALTEQRRAAAIARQSNSTGVRRTVDAGPPDLTAEQLREAQRMGLTGDDQKWFQQSAANIQRAIERGDALL